MAQSEPEPGDAAIAAAGQLLPAALFAALTALLVVVAPRLAVPTAWMLVAVAAVVALFGPLFGMSSTIIDASPFAAAPAPTSGGVDAGGILPLTLGVVVMIGAALGAMRQRDLRP